MSHVRRSMYRRKLDDILARADDEAFFIMCWATRAIQSGRAANAWNFLSFPPEFVVSEIHSPLMVHPWRIETLLNEVLATKKHRIVPGRPNRILNCRNISAMTAVVNMLARLENAEDGITLKHINVLDEMPRIAHRQFEWQRGFFSISQLYKAGFLYSGDRTRTFFEQSNGFSIDDFSLACFTFQALYRHRPTVTLNEGIDEIGLSQATLQSVLALISLPHAEARAKTQELRRGSGPVAYKPSLFRTYPCVRFDAGRTVTPLPELLSLRATSGLFYDVISGTEDVKNEISGRFETYCRDLLDAMLPGLRVSPSYKYLIRKGQTMDTPDVLLYEKDEISVVFECKATRMSHEARFSENPITDAQRGYAEIAKGVFQIWRFVSHVRRGLVPKERVGPNARGVVLTLDTWLAMANTMQNDVLEMARKMADERDAEIIDQDCIRVIFCPIEDLELTLQKATPVSFLDGVRATTEDRYKGWMLSSVHKKVMPEIEINNIYPFTDKIAEVLPWWTRFSTSVGD